MDDLGASAFPLALLFMLLNTAVFVLVLYLTTTATVNKKFLSLSIDTQGATCTRSRRNEPGRFQEILMAIGKLKMGFNSTLLCSSSNSLGTG
jgi:hypothetical protein